MSNIKTLFLHIGRAKTGTTSLQMALTANREALAAEGYCYPVAGAPNGYSHARMALICQQDKVEQQAELVELRRRLEDETASFGKVIISSEGFQNVVSGKRVEYLFNRNRGAFGDCRRYSLITVCYLREFLDYARSSYAQRVQATGMFCRFDDYCVQFSKFDLERFIRFWRGLSDKSEFISYDQAVRMSAGVVDDFAARVGLMSPLDHGGGNHNVTIAGNLLVFKLAVNRVVPHRPEFYRALMRLAQISSRFRGAFYIDPRRRDYLRTKLSTYNKVLRETVGDTFELKQYTGEQLLFDESRWQSDLEMFLEQPEFSDLKSCPPFFELRPGEWLLNDGFRSAFGRAKSALYKAFVMRRA